MDAFLRSQQAQLGPLQAAALGAQLYGTGLDMDLGTRTNAQALTQHPLEYAWPDDRRYAAPEGAGV